MKVRKQEGMEMVKGFIGPEFPTLVQIEENGVKYEVDVKRRAEDRIFLDQKYNRLAIQKLCKGAKSSGLLYTYRFLCTQCRNCRR